MKIINWIVIGGIVAAIGWVASNPVLRGYVTGAKVVLLENSVNLGEVTAGETRFVSVSLKNITSHPIEVCGGTTSCGCALVKGLPFEIPPGEIRSCEVEYRPRTADVGQARENLVLFHLNVECPIVVFTFSSDVCQ